MESALAPTRIRKQETRIEKSKTWTPEEDELLTQLVSQAAPPSWSVLASYFPNKTAPQLAGRWEKVINPNLVKGSWTREEDETIISYVQSHGDKDWAKLALSLKGRTGKQCRERFKNHLDDSVKRGAWTPEEDNLLIDLHAQHGNSWTTISSFFDGRTDNCIKNRWNSTIKKRLERLQKGEPLVMKRGRKPKSSCPIPPPVILPTEETISPISSCSSPLTFSRTSRPKFPLIELGTSSIVSMMNSSLSFRPENFTGKIQLHTLEQNRMDLQRMLNDLTSC